MVPSGVPQGSVLGPLLFVLFVNSVLDQFKGVAFAFADDIKIVGCPATLLDDIRVALRWSVKHDLPLNDRNAAY